MKKLLSLILALALVSICAAAFAADLDDGSIQITPPAGLYHPCLSDRRTLAKL